MADINGTYDPLSPVYLNLNPLDIKDPNWESWFNFKLYIQRRNPALSNELKINKTAGKDITDTYIRDYNSLPTTSVNRRITEDNIKAVQEFNKITDPSVVVDGWVGTQTAKLEYPGRKTFILTTPPGVNNALPKFTQLFYDAPVFWGNKRYIISYKTINDNYRANGNTFNIGSIQSSNYKLYDPSVTPLNENLGLSETINYFNGTPKAYSIYNGSTVISYPFNWEDPFFILPQLPKPGIWPPESIANKTPTKINKETEEEQKRNDSQKQGTQAVNGITQSPR